MRTLLLVLILASPAFATNYYADWVGGDDTHAGTSTATAWKHGKDMGGCTSVCASATLNPGDSMILKGGVTWPMNTTGPWTPQFNGTIGNCVRIGVDQSWFTGGSWTRPILNGNGVNIGSDNIFLRYGLSNLCVDNLEFTGGYWNDGTFGHSQYMNIFTATNVTVTNCYWHGWSSPVVLNTTGSIMSGSATLTVASAGSAQNGWPIAVAGAAGGGNPLLTSISSGAGTTTLTLASMASATVSGAIVQSGVDQGRGVSGSTAGGGNQNSIFQYNWIDGSDTAEVIADPSCTGSYLSGKCQGSLNAFYAGPMILRNNYIGYVSNGVVTAAQEFTGNLVENGRFSLDPGNHQNAYESNGDDCTNGLLFAGNVFRKNFRGSTEINIGLSPQASCTPSYAYDNVSYDNTNGNIFGMLLSANNQGGSMPQGTITVFNNTIQCGNTGSTLSGDCTGCLAVFTSCTFYNDHFINLDGVVATAIANSTASNTHISHNVAQTATASASQGYNDMQMFAFSPTAITNATVAAGTPVCGVLITCSGNLATAAFDTAYSCNFNATNHTVSCPARTVNPWLATPDAGAYQFQTTPSTATPTICIPAFCGSGNTSSPQTVTLATATSGAALCFTTDLSTPTTNGAGACNHGTTYSVPFSKTVPGTVKAVAGKSGFSDSAVATATYGLVATGGIVITGGISITGGVTVQ